MPGAPARTPLQSGLHLPVGAISLWLPSCLVSLLAAGKRVCYEVFMKTIHIIFTSLVVFVGCNDQKNSEDADASPSDAGADTGTPTERPSDTDTGYGTSGGSDTDTGGGVDGGMDGGAAGGCERLFGVPSEKNGLDDSLCRPACECDGEVFAAPAYTEAEIDALADRELLNPPDLLTADPYADPGVIREVPGAVCAVVQAGGSRSSYRIETFDSVAAAEAAGATVTHYGACGLCSSLADLAVYMRYPDLTEPVRSCGIEGVLNGEEANMTCLRNLGFEEPCAQIWYYNTVNTRTHCMAICMTLMEAPYNTPDGRLNECLQCDEDNSGPVFKAVAGRTRRNSGLPTAICRPCDGVAPIVHEYL